MNVSESSLQKCKKIVSDTQADLHAILQRTLKRLQIANSEWNDEAYLKFEEIVLEFVQEVKGIFTLLTSFENYLDRLYKIVQEYTEDGNGATYINLSDTSSFVSDTLSNTRLNNNERLKNGLHEINNKLNAYRNELLNRGVPAGLALSTVLDGFRHRLQSQLLSRLNGNNVSDDFNPNFDEIASNIRGSGFSQSDESFRKPRNIAHTMYGFQEIILNNQRMEVYDDPVGTNSLLIQVQDHSAYDMAGTCGLCQCANIATMAGVPTTENDVISEALQSSDMTLTLMDLFNADRNLRGGTSCETRKEILERLGIPTYLMPISINKMETVRCLANAVASGHGVIVSVDVERLWRNGQTGNHAISLISVTRDGTSFIYNDTGAGVSGIISSVDLAACLNGRPANITENVIR